MKAFSSSAQPGYILLPLVAVVGIVSLGAFLLPALRSHETVREHRTAASLATAREALIGRASADDTRPGSLPCPDLDDDGVADGPFGNCTSYLGRLPWRTLGLADVRDGWGERLWYALTPAYRDNPAGGVLNADTPGAYTVRNGAGTVLAAEVPALLIAPGAPLPTQSRLGSGRLSAAMYLDGENADGDTSYLSAPASASFNDRVMIIAREDLFRPVAARVAREARAGLERYRTAHGRYPAANPYGSRGPAYFCDPAALEGRVPRTIRSDSPSAGCSDQAPWNGELPDWFFDNDWHLVTHYAVAAACIDPAPSAEAQCTADGGSAALAIAEVSSAVRAIVIVSGPARPGQSRPCAAAGHCVDDGPNADGDRLYVRPSRWPASNDRMTATCAAAASCEAMP